jgi:hypothetical protein
MKKLMVALATVVVGLAVNAATVSWQAKSGWVSPDDDAALEGATFYLFDATAYTIATFTSDMGAGADAFSNALGSGTVTDEGEVVFSGSGLTYANDGSKDLAKAYGVILANDGSADYYYMVGEGTPVEVTSAIIAGAKAVFDFGDVVTGAVGGAGWTSASSSVPEPTSGLLLLLGMAGLALKRKHA